MFPQCPEYVQKPTRSSEHRPLHFNLAHVLSISCTYYNKENCASGAMQDKSMNTTLEYKRFKFVDTHLRGMSLPQQERHQGVIIKCHHHITINLRLLWSKEGSIFRSHRLFFFFYDVMEILSVINEELWKVILVISDKHCAIIVLLFNIIEVLYKLTHLQMHRNIC